MTRSCYIVAGLLKRQAASVDEGKNALCAHLLLTNNGYRQNIKLWWLQVNHIYWISFWITIQKCVSEESGMSAFYILSCSNISTYLFSPHMTFLMSWWIFHIIKHLLHFAYILSSCAIKSCRCFSIIVTLLHIMIL